MWTAHFLFIFLFVYSDACNGNAELPSYIPACYRDDTNFNTCLLKTADLVRPYLRKGIPELELPPLSPYLIPKIISEEYNDDANYVLVLRNVTLRGLDSYDFTRFRFDPDALKLVASFKINHLNLEGTFTCNGKVLGVPTEGDGPFTLNITNSEGTIKQLLALTTRKGVSYLEPLLDITKIDIGTFSYLYKGLHEDTVLLARTADRALHDYESHWMQHLKAAIEKEIIKIINAWLQNLYKAVPYDNLFPYHK